jgi:hypothetical protein
MAPGMMAPCRPPEAPTGLVDITDHDSRVGRTHRQPPMQGYNARLVVNDTAIGDPCARCVRGGPVQMTRVDRWLSEFGYSPSRPWSALTTAISGRLMISRSPSVNSAIPAVLLMTS